MLMVYGASGSGKYFLIATFCAELNFNLIRVPFSGTRPQAHLPLIYEYARENQPCIVVFDDCNGMFRPEQKNNVEVLMKEIMMNRSMVPDIDITSSQAMPTGTRIWSIFSSIENPNHQRYDPIMQNAIRMSAWSGIPKHDDCLTEKERFDAFVYALAQNIREDEEPPYTPQNLMDLARIAKYSTVGDIYSFVSDVFENFSNTMDLSQLQALPYNHPALLPPFDFFVRQIYSPGEGKKWLSTSDPHEKNVKYYLPSNFFGDVSKYDGAQSSFDKEYNNEY